MVVMVPLYSLVQQPLNCLDMCNTSVIEAHLRFYYSSTDVDDTQVIVP